MDSKSAEEPLFHRGSGQSQDTFYDTTEISSPDYDNAVNQSHHLIQDPAERARQEEEWRQELAKLEEEITTLQSVLHSKTQQASELKRKLGITTVTELKKDLKQGVQNIRDSNAYQKTTATFKSLGAFASRKMGDMRNSNAFKSFEDKVGGAYGSVKRSMSGSKSENNFDEALRTSETPDTSADTRSPSATGDATTPKLPEEKVPL